MRDWTALAAQYPERFVWLDDGPLPVLSGGGGDKPAKVPPPPGPTPQEIAIQEQQVSLLKIQVAQAERQNQIYSSLDPAEMSQYLQDQVTLSRQQVERATRLGPQEEALAEKQLAFSLRQMEAAEKGMKLQEQLQPFVLQSMRLVDEGGAVRRMTEDEYVGTLGAQEKLAYSNMTLALEREGKALRGELPLSEAGQQRKRDEFTAFKEQMARGGNPIEGDAPGAASATTTAGNQALKAFNERWGLVEEAERRGELTAGSQSVLAKMGVASDIGARQREGLLSAVPQYGAPGYVPMTGRGSGGGGFGIPGAGTPDFAGALQPYQAQRAGQMQTGFANVQAQLEYEKRQAAQYGAIGSGVGTVLGAAVGAYFGGPAGAMLGGAGGGAVGGAAGTYISSSRDVKKDIRRASRSEERGALEMVKNLKTHTFRYKHESSSSAKRIGMMADEVPAAIATPDRRGIDVGRTLGLLTAATRELARQKGR